MGAIPRTIYAKAVLIDTGAIYALVDTSDAYHQKAKQYLEEASQQSLPLFITNSTIIESYRLIIHRLGWKVAIEFLRNMYSSGNNIRIERMTVADEEKARSIVEKFKEHILTLTDAVNYSVMLRIGILNIFSFDSDCYLLGLQKLPY